MSQSLFKPTLPPSLDLHVQVGGTEIIVKSFTVVSGSYGSVGHARFETSQKLLSDFKIDLLEISQSAPLVSVQIFAETPTTPHTKIFDGDLLNTNWDMDRDEVVVHARDHAGVFVDQHRILARDAGALTGALGPLSPGQQLTPAGIATMNRTVAQVVTDIAQQFGYTPVINGGTANTPAGAAYGSSDRAYMTIPQNLWSILNTLAKDTGNEVYTTPDRKLVFGPPGVGLPTVNLSWGTGADVRLPNLVPCAQLVFRHQPRRNSTFRVLVISYDPATAQVTEGSATVIGPDLATSAVPAGTYSGAQAGVADKALADDAQTSGYGSHNNLSHVQLYTFHWDGLTAADCNARAAAIAADITKRLVLLSCTIDGYPTLTPTQKLSVTGNRLNPFFSGNTWFVSGFQHEFSMPGPGHHRGWSGFRTQIQALDLPNNALSGTVR